MQRVTMSLAAIPSIARETGNGEENAIPAVRRGLRQLEDAE